MSSEPSRFQTAAQHYLAGRLPYPPALIGRVAQLCGLDPTHRILDLGCGPGQLALAFAPFARQVIGIDPEPEMLRIARAEAARAGQPIEFREGAAPYLDADLGIFRIVTIGRAFHWMERLATLRRLDALIEPGGAVVLFGDDHLAVPDNRWTAAFERLIDHYAEDDTARATRRAPDWPRHEAVLLNSPFPYLERVSRIVRYETPLERLVDRALSLSSVSHGRIGARADDLAREMREALVPYARDGIVTEVVESQALIARRSGD